MNFTFCKVIKFLRFLQYIQYTKGIQASVHEFTVIFKDCIINASCFIVRKLKLKVIYTPTGDFLIVRPTRVSE